MARTIGWALLTALLCAGPVHSQPSEVEVRLFQAHAPIGNVAIDPPLELVSPLHEPLPGNGILLRWDSGRVKVIGVGKGTANKQLLSSSKIALNGRDRPIMVHFDPTHARSYRGVIYVTAGKDGLQIVNRVPMRDYIKSVVGSESTIEFPTEALKAQSVLAQTLMARYKQGDELNDTTEKQAYLGVSSVSEAVAAAVDQTWGRRLTFKGRPATVYFHSTCAGGTSNGEEYFGLKRGAFPYLAGRSCNYCRQSPFWQTKTSEIPQTVFQQYFGKQPVSVLSVDQQRRPLSVAACGRTMSGYELWMQMGQKLGWDKVPGTRYAIANGAKAVTVTSTGAGHGVGLCQWGACGMAHAGKTYLEILRYYFPGTNVEQTGK